MKTERCPICASTEIRPLIPAGVLPEGIGVDRCHACETVFLDERAERQDYWQSSPQEEIYLQADVRSAQEQEFSKRLDEIEKSAAKGKLLDVGGGLGHFALCASKRGWQAELCDVSPAAVQFAREKLSLTAHLGKLESLNLPENSYDLITLWDVIEHFTDPLPPLEKIQRLLRSGGQLVIKTPNENGFFKLAARAAFRLSLGTVIFPLKYVYYSPHFFSFNEHSLGKLLTRLGFRVTRVAFEHTDREFASSKIKQHYGKSSESGLIRRFLPLGFALAELLGAPNKIVVYARKS